MTNDRVATHRVVIIGGGFGGLSAARGLRRTPVGVTLVDRRNFHLFQPLLYQVATGGLSPANIAAPLRSILRRQANTRVVLGDAISVDPERRGVALSDGELAFDTLVVATGARHHYFGHEAWEALAPGLKTLEDATDILCRILLAFEAAEREQDPELVKRWLTFVIIGGGPTGVELAGAVGEISNYTLRHDYRSIRPEEAKIILLEATDRVLPTYPPPLSLRAERDLARLGVEVRTGTAVTEVQSGAVILHRGEESERIETKTVLWAVGTIGSPLGKALAEATGAQTDRSGRIVVGPDLSLPGYPNIFVLGDLAHFEQDEESLPAVAPVAMQQGRYVAEVISSRLQGKTPASPFRYRNRGSMATIGRSAAVVDLGWLRLTGSVGWLIWLFVHLMSLAQFENRLLVLIQWAWNYLTRNRSARLIIGQNSSSLQEQFTSGPSGESGGF